MEIYYNVLSLACKENTISIFFAINIL